MNENPEGTPNPLNAKPDVTPVDEILDANPSEPVEEETVAVSETIAEPMEITEAKTSETQVDVIAGEPPMVQTETISAANVTTGSLDPTGRMMEPMPQPAEDAKSKHKKKGMVFMIIGCILFLAGIAAAVVAVVLMTNKSDPVNAAMEKIMSGNAPKNIAIDGDINILVNDPAAMIQRVNIDLDSDTVLGSMINTSSAVITLTDRTNNDYSAKFEEVYAANGDLYFKIEGATELLEDSNVLDLFTSNTNTVGVEANCPVDENGAEVDCVTEVKECSDGSGRDCIVTTGEGFSSEIYVDEGVNTIDSGASSMTDAMNGMIISAVEAADGVWLRLSTESLNLSEGELLGMNTSAISCVTNLVGDVNKNSNSAIDMYRKYPFIVSSDKDVLIASKQNPVYQVSIDSENFTNYINAINNTNLARTLYSCMGWNNNAAVTESDVSKIVNAMPKIYAEVNSENNFTRLYLESTINDGAANATIDLGFSYPTNVNVREPVEYTNYEDFIQTIFTTMYNMNGQGTVQTTEVVEQAG